MNPLTNVRNVKKLSQRELEGHHGKTSWHDDYKDSAWIFVGGMPYDLTEGDVLTVFSQWGEIVNINMVRDKATGKFKGFGFICYENQRSTVLAVDNFNGIKILGRTVRVDHVKDYKPPKDTDKLDDITRQLYDQGCAPGTVQETKTVVDGYELLEDDEDDEFRDDGFGTHSVLKAIADSSTSRSVDDRPSTSVSDNGFKNRLDEGAVLTSKSSSHKHKEDVPKDKDKDSRHSKSLKRSHKSKTSKKKHSKSSKKKKRKHRRRSSSSSESSSSSSESDSDSDSSDEPRKKSSSKRDRSPHSKKRRRD